MRRVANLPASFRRFARMSGVLDFALFEDAEGSEDEMIAALPALLGEREVFDAEALRRLGSRPIGKRAFFGGWYDHDRGLLVQRGSYTTAAGERLDDPLLSKLDGMAIVAGAAPAPEAGAGGEFAYAFANPPYGLQASPREVQSVFEEIRDLILPPRHNSIIRDWSSPGLPAVSRYFAAGMEWWGVFLFSIYVPAIRRLTIIAGSTTD